MEGLLDRASPDLLPISPSSSSAPLGAVSGAGAGSSASLASSASSPAASSRGTVASPSSRASPHSPHPLEPLWPQSAVGDDSATGLESPHSSRYYSAPPAPVVSHTARPPLSPLPQVHRAWMDDEEDTAALSRGERASSLESLRLSPPPGDSRERSILEAMAMVRLKRQLEEDPTKSLRTLDYLLNELSSLTSTLKEQRAAMASQDASAPPPTVTAAASIALPTSPLRASLALSSPKAAASAPASAPSPPAKLAASYPASPKRAPSPGVQPPPPTPRLPSPAAAAAELSHALRQLPSPPPPLPFSAPPLLPRAGSGGGGGGGGGSSSGATGGRSSEPVSSRSFESLVYSSGRGSPSTAASKDSPARRGRSRSGSLEFMDQLETIMEQQYVGLLKELASGPDSPLRGTILSPICHSSSDSPDVPGRLAPDMAMLASTPVRRDRLGDSASSAADGSGEDSDDELGDIFTPRPRQVKTGAKKTVVPRLPLERVSRETDELQLSPDPTKTPASIHSPRSAFSKTPASSHRSDDSSPTTPRLLSPRTEMADFSKKRSELDASFEERALELNRLVS
eukprot:PLAT6873.3.p1 GENE.PLAT6873.3~~PLAT6873.3.p1  ORF type:complete len:570 (-),score=117.48 PLAT6873.3:1042-2751(-)